MYASRELFVKHALDDFVRLLHSANPKAGSPRFACPAVYMRRRAICGRLRNGFELRVGEYLETSADLVEYHISTLSEQTRRQKDLYTV